MANLDNGPSPSGGSSDFVSNIVNRRLAETDFSSLSAEEALPLLLQFLQGSDIASSDGTSKEQAQQQARHPKSLVPKGSRLEVGIVDSVDGKVVRRSCREFLK